MTGKKILMLVGDYVEDPAVGPEVTASGGKYVELPLTEAHVDGNLVTGPAWPAHPSWLAKFLQVLEKGTREKAAKA